jgi:hypothetical protein
MADLPTVEFNDVDRRKAFHVVENIDAFLTQERWLKGGWFKTNGASHGSNKGLHTECLANFIRRVELGGQRLNMTEDGDDGNYSGARSVTEYVVAKAIKHEFPMPFARHLHIKEEKYEEGAIIEPGECDLNDGKACATCRSKRFKDEITIEVEYGAFAASDPGEIIPEFNDHPGTTYGDVKRVIETSRRIIRGSGVTYADEVMSDKERRDIELASIEAQRDIDTEQIDAWLANIERQGWTTGVSQRIATSWKKGIDKDAELAKEEVLRQDCVNC